jgi:hypothetical protein
MFQQIAGIFKLPITSAPAALKYLEAQNKNPKMNNIPTHPNGKDQASKNPTLDPSQLLPGIQDFQESICIQKAKIS